MRKKDTQDFKSLVLSKMKELDLSGSDLGVILGLNPLYARQDFYRRLNNDTFSRKELFKLKIALKIPFRILLMVESKNDEFNRSIE